ncbi:MAG: shikimate kinase [Jatrophihabitantaceae bacterium]
MPPRAVLVGLPGTGKSTVGARLARRLSLPFADSDRLVAERAGRSVSEIFEQDGEPAFRQLEAETIGQALAGFDGILALGGGAVTTEAVRVELGAAGVPVVLLTADQDELLHRMAGARHRPLLAGDPAGRLAELSRQRDRLYREVATLTVPTGGRSVAQVTERVFGQLTRTGRSTAGPR